MPDIVIPNTEIYPYVVLGDGEVSSENMTAHQLSTNNVRLSIPTFMYAKTLDEANNIADVMKPWNATVLICKIEHVIQ